jgi:hypothetical protein
MGQYQDNNPVNEGCKMLFAKWPVRVVTSPVFFIGVVLMLVSFMVGVGFLYANEVQTLEERHPSLFPDPINFTLSADYDSFYIKDTVFLDGNDTVILTSTPDSGAPPLSYRMRTSVSGDSTLCEVLQVTVDTLQYEGQLQSLDIHPIYTSNPSWELNFSLTEGVALPEVAECVVTIHLLGWDETRTMFQKKYRAENFIELTFKADTPNLFKELFEVVSDSLLDTPGNASSGEELSVDEVIMAGAEDQNDEDSPSATSTEEALPQLEIDHETTPPAATTTVESEIILLPIETPPLSNQSDVVEIEAINETSVSEVVPIETEL